MTKKLTMTLAATAIVALAVFLLMIPAALPGADSGTATVTRMYSENSEGPWSDTPYETTKYILEITSIDGITTIIIQEVIYLWEDPEGTLVFQGQKGSKGETGPKGEPGKVPVFI